MRLFGWGRPKPCFRREDWGLVAFIPATERPVMLSVVNPTGSNGAVAGYIVPLGKSREEVDLMHDRLWDGAYGVVSPDKKGALHLTVGPIAEVMGVGEEVLVGTTGGEAPMVERLQAVLRSDPVGVAVRILDPGQEPEKLRDLLYLTGDRVAVLGAGVMLDVEVSRWWQAGEWTQTRVATEITDPILYCNVGEVESTVPPGIWLHTLGLRRLGHEELAVLVRWKESARHAGCLLWDCATYLCSGARYRVGDVVSFLDRLILRVAKAPKDLDGAWPGFDGFQLCPTGVPIGEGPAYVDVILEEFIESLRPSREPSDDKPR